MLFHPPQDRQGLAHPAWVIKLMMSPIDTRSREPHSLGQQKPSPGPTLSDCADGASEELAISGQLVSFGSLEISKQAQKDSKIS